jgi:hypothetical protein
VKIYGICLVKQIKTIVKWCDSIYVFDNGSDDQTWKIALDLSMSYERIILYKPDDCIYEDNLRKFFLTITLVNLVFD